MMCSDSTLLWSGCLASNGVWIDAVHDSGHRKIGVANAAKVRAQLEIRTGSGGGCDVGNGRRDCDQSNSRDCGCCLAPAGGGGGSRLGDSGK